MSIQDDIFAIDVSMKRSKNRKAWENFRDWACKNENLIYGIIEENHKLREAIQVIKTPPKSVLKYD